MANPNVPYYVAGGFKYYVVAIYEQEDGQYNIIEDVTELDDGLVNQIRAAIQGITQNGQPEQLLDKEDENADGEFPYKKFRIADANQGANNNLSNNLFHLKHVGPGFPNHMFLIGREDDLDLVMGEFNDPDDITGLLGTEELFLENFTIADLAQYNTPNGYNVIAYSQAQVDAAHNNDNDNDNNNNNNQDGGRRRRHTRRGRRHHATRRHRKHKKTAHRKHKKSSKRRPSRRAIRRYTRRRA